jgi:hypothetical protein
MKAVRKFLLGGAAAAAATVVIAAPAAAQYYPYPGGGGDVLVGTILNNILRGGYNGYGGYQYNGYDYGNERWAVDQCARATEQRVNGGYGGYGGYGYNNRGGLRVAQIDRVERTRNLNFRVYGLVTDAGYRGNYGGYYGGYNAPYGGYGYNQGVPAYRFSCKVSRSTGRITDIDLDRINGNYGYRRY